MKDGIFAPRGGGGLSRHLNVVAGLLEYADNLDMQGNELGRLQKAGEGATGCSPPAHAPSSTGDSVRSAFRPPERGYSINAVSAL